MERIHLALGILLCLVLGFILATPGVPVSAMTLNQTNVTVTVQNVTWIRIEPVMINFTGQPGTLRTSDNDTLTITNIGSQNITAVNAYVDTITVETSRPYGGDDPSAYAAGGVLVIKNESTQPDFMFLGRYEWNWTRNIPLSDSPTGTLAEGFFKNITNEYYWSIHNGTGAPVNNDCANVSASGVDFRIEDEEDAGTTGTRDTEPAPIGDALTVASSVSVDGQDWGVVRYTSGPLNGYCIALHESCDRIYIYEYDGRFDNTDACVNDIIEITLAPGDLTSVELRAYLPYGIPAGEMSPAVLTFEASSW
jgi:hypothetical protein